MIINKERKISKKEIVLITIGGTLILLLAVILCLKSIKGKESYTMHYSDSSQLDYNVYLKKNNFYTTPYLPKDRMYIANLIDYINTHFDYTFEVAEEINLGYKYYIVAQVVVDGKTDKKIFDTEEILVDATDIQKINGKKFSISEQINIDYNKYNHLASAFIDEYGISAKANMIVSMYVDIEGTTEKFTKKLNDRAVVSLEIPLTTELTEIKMNYDLTNNSNQVFEYGKTSIIHPYLFALSVIVAILDIVIVVYEIIQFIINKDIKVKYQEKLKKIFRDYGNYISKKSVTTKTKEIMYTMSLRVEIVNSFDDLINVRDNLEKPILFYESVPGEQAVFYIIDTKVSYIYIMNARDLDTKKKKKENNAIETINSNALTNKTNIDDSSAPVVEESGEEESIKQANETLNQEETIASDEPKNLEIVKEKKDTPTKKEKNKIETKASESKTENDVKKKNEAKSKKGVYRRKTKKKNQSNRNYQSKKN